LRLINFDLNSYVTFLFFLRTAHCLLRTAHCVLRTAYCALRTASYIFFYI
jgi:hypothetical protein